jgi:hypothetical protein
LHPSPTSCRLVFRCWLAAKMLLICYVCSAKMLLICSVMLANVGKEAKMAAISISLPPEPLCTGAMARVLHNQQGYHKRRYRGSDHIGVALVGLPACHSDSADEKRPKGNECRVGGRDKEAGIACLWGSITTTKGCSLNTNNATHQDPRLP